MNTLTSLVALVVVVAYAAAVSGKDTIIFNGSQFKGKHQLAASQPSAESKPAVDSAKQSPDAEDGFLVSSPMLSLALNLDRCKSGSTSADCSFGNSVFSPLSIASTLTMLLAGTNGTCYDQLRKALGYADGLDDKQINAAYQHIMNRTKKLDREQGSAITLNVANSLFSKSEMKMEFLRTANRFFASNAYHFSSAASLTITANQWVANKTNNRIKNIIGSVAPDTQLIVANVVYLNANWADPFLAELTTLQDFHVSPTETVQVAMMSDIGEVFYVDDKDLGLKMIGKPYAGEQLAMYLIVPTDNQGVKSLKNLEARLSDVIIRDLMDRMTAKTVSLAIPKFRIRQKLSLKNRLREMGVLALFSADDANLSRMISKPGVAVDDVVHQTFIEVTESGTEAAAATVANPTRTGPTRSFQANQPFMFFIMDVPTRSVIFSGRVTRPEFS